jgi:RNA polymerase sigma-70 factor (ECF subfamily)
LELSEDVGLTRLTEVRDDSDEAKIIASIRAGSTHLFHDLIRPYERKVYAMALALVKNAEDAEDVAQEAFLKALRNLDVFRAEAKFSTWLISIALNEARAKLRRARTVRIESLDDDAKEARAVLPDPLWDWREVPSEMIEQLEVRQWIEDAVSELPVIYREVFLLRDVEELSIGETSQMLGISISSVKVRLHRARMLMQKRLAPQLKQLQPKRRWLPW